MRWVNACRSAAVLTEEGDKARRSAFRREECVAANPGRADWFARSRLFLNSVRLEGMNVLPHELDRRETGDQMRDIHDFPQPFGFGRVAVRVVVDEALRIAVGREKP